jgi:cytochrome c peroxidase
MENNPVKHIKIFTTACCILLTLAKPSQADTLFEQGRSLFYENNLSLDKSVSCSSCHQQEYGFSDPRRVSEGINGKTLRNSMSLINNSKNITRQFWNARSKNLKDQVLLPIQDHQEMGMTLRLVEQRTGMRADQVASALQAFVSDIVIQADRPQTRKERHGARLFRNKGCARCHTANRGDLYFVPHRLTDNGTNMGLSKVPSLVGIQYTAPYMQDGRKKTLMDVLNHYASFNQRGRGLPRNVSISRQEKSDIVAFLEGLTDPAHVMQNKWSNPN